MYYFDIFHKKYSMYIRLIPTNHLIIASEAHAKFTKLNQEEYKHHQQQQSMIPT